MPTKPARHPPPVPQAHAFALPGMILVLAPTLDADDRGAVIDTLLLASLAASTEDGDSGTWRTTLLRVLGKVGWNAEEFRDIRYKAPSASLTIGRAITTAAEQVGEPDEVAPLAAAIEQAPDDARAAGLLARGGDDSGTRALTVALAREQDGTVGLQLVAVRSDLRRASARSERPLDLETMVQGADIQVSTAHLLLQPSVYQAVAAAVHDKVSKARSDDLLPLGHLETLLE